MAAGKAYRFKCRNIKCQSEFHRYYTDKFFEEMQYGTESGWSCFNCGYPRMAVTRSLKSVKDNFQPGWQPNIRKNCWTYGQYKEELKQRGLIEIGNEDLPEYEGKPQFWSDETIKALYDQGIKLDEELIKEARKA